MQILAIETSCDETAVSVVNTNPLKILSHQVSSQTAIHAHWGGVVPSLAKREHLKNLPLLLKKAMAEISKTKSPISKIDLIAVTQGPGLEPALWTGITFAVKLSQTWGVPLLPVNHLAGHIYAPLLNNKPVPFNFPALALIVSGGHTLLVLITAWGKHQIIGETQDDAVGEAFDKVARLMDLPYPGGPEIARLADSPRGRSSWRVSLPRPMLNSGNLNFSFSGLKTAVLYAIKARGKLSADDKINLAKEFQNAAVEVLLKKTARAVKQFAPKLLILGGGVANNNLLRQEFAKLAAEQNLPAVLPDANLTTDNASMIAAAAWAAIKSGQKPMEKPSHDPFPARGNLPL